MTELSLGFLWFQLLGGPYNGHVVSLTGVVSGRQVNCTVPCNSAPMWGSRANGETFETQFLMFGEGIFQGLGLRIRLSVLGLSVQQRQMHRSRLPKPDSLLLLVGACSLDVGRGLGGFCTRENSYVRLCVLAPEASSKLGFNRRSVLLALHKPSPSTQPFWMCRQDRHCLAGRTRSRLGQDNDEIDRLHYYSDNEGNSNANDSDTTAPHPF